jgi:hypothetical protein
MRWKFPDPEGDDARRAVLGHIDAFWRAFAARASDIDALFQGRTRWDLPAFMAEQLATIHPSLSWEFGPGERGGQGHSLILSSRARRSLAPLAAVVLQRAPQIPGWQALDHRPPVDLASADSAARALTGQSLEGWSVQATAGEGNAVDLLFTSPACTTPHDRAQLRLARVAAEQLLGSEVFGRWVGSVELGPSGSAARPAPLEGLRRKVDELRQGITASLLRGPCHAHLNDARWSLFRLTPRKAADHPRQLDMFVGKTMLPPLWRAAHEGLPFSSARFSRVGETFCYVKLEGEGGAAEGGFEDKQQIEDALNDALVPAKLGCAIGGGSGLRYGYIDLALTQLGPGIEACRRVLRDGHAPARSWLQFFDDELADEWVGVHDDAPLPPGIT